MNAGVTDECLRKREGICGPSLCFSFLSWCLISILGDHFVASRGGEGGGWRGEGTHAGKEGQDWVEKQRWGIFRSERSRLKWWIGNHQPGVM